MNENTLLYKALQMPARFLPIMVLLWIGVIVGLIYLMVVI